MKFKTKPQYLALVDRSLSPEHIYKIDYDVVSKNLRAYPLTELLDRPPLGGALARSIKPVIIIALHDDDGDKTSTYRWYRPNIYAIVEEENFDLLKHFLIQDVLVHI